MRKSRLLFKYALRKCKRNKNAIVANNIAEKLCKKDDKAFCRGILGLWLRLECSLDSLSIVSTDHQIDRGLSVSLRLYEMCHVLVIV